MTKPNPGNDSLKPEHQESVTEKLLLSFNDQFATNQNHHQSIFLQFLSAILIVLIGYGFIYANTGSTSDMYEIQIDAKSTTYAIFHLAGAYTISQFILTLLATVVVNIGYGFRRDQNVIYKIRIKYLGQKKYEEIFGKVTFLPQNQSVFDFLPEFNRMFFLGLYVLQVLLFVSFAVRLKHSCYYDNFSGFRWLDYVIYLIPIIWNTWLYLNYYKKYYRAMNNENEKWLKIFFG